MADLHSTMGFGNLMTGDGFEEDNQIASRTIDSTMPRAQSSTAHRKPDASELMEQLQKLQGEHTNGDPTGNMEALRTDNG